MRTTYLTASTVNGFLASPEQSLDWLFAVEGDHPDYGPFFEAVTVLVVGATTYEWVLGHERLLETPAKWQEFYGDRPTYLFSHRDLPVPAGADVRRVSGPVLDAIGAIEAAAGEGTVWLQGGGDLVGQFLDIGALHEIQISFAPAFLAAGAPLLPRDIGPDRLHLRGAEPVGQFIHATYEVVPA